MVPTVLLPHEAKHTQLFHILKLEQSSVYFATKGKSTSGVIFLLDNPVSLNWTSDRSDTLELANGRGVQEPECRSGLRPES